MKITGAMVLCVWAAASGCGAKNTAQPRALDASTDRDADEEFGAESGPSITTLAMIGGVTGLAVGGDSVYVLQAASAPFEPVDGPTGGALYRVPASGGRAVVLLRELDLVGDAAPSDPSEFSGPFGLAIDDADIYWANEGSRGINADFLDGGIRRASVDGGPSKALASGAATGGLAVDARYVYWIQGPVGDGALVKVPKTGGATVTLLASGVASPAIALDPENVYVSRQGGMGTQTNIVKVNKTSGSVAVLVQAQSLGGLAVDGTTLYWLEQHPGRIHSVGLSGEDPGVLAVTDGSPVDIALDDTSVYWTTDQGVQKVGIDGGRVRTIASGQGAFICVDATSVYWMALADAEPERLMKLSPK